MFENWFPQDMTTLRKLLWFRTAWEKSGKPPVPTDPLNTFVGSIVRFFSHRALPVVKLEANFTPIQSGTGDPSPENIRPISGHTGCEVVRTGRNLLPNKTHTYASNTWLGVDNHTDLFYFYLPAGTYTLSATLLASSSLWMRSSTATSNTRISSSTASTAPYGTFTVTKPDFYRFWASGITAENVVSFQLELGSTASDYEPYNGTTVSISFGQTVYGGKLTVFEDGSGQIVAETVCVAFDGSTTGKKMTNWGQFNGVPVAYASFTDGYEFGKDMQPTKAQAEAKGAMCSHVGYADLTSVSTLTETPQSYFFRNNANGTFQIRLYNENCATLGECNTWLADLNTAGTPLQIVYPLATPITIPLTPGQIQTLVGENNVWVNDATGDITVQAYGTAIT